VFVTSGEPLTPILEDDAVDGSTAPSVEELFRAHAADVGRYLVAMVGDRALAEDLLQDTFIDAMRARDRLPQIENPRAWLYGIARNRALRAFRGRRRLQRALRRLGGSDAIGAEEAVVVALLDLLKRELTPELRGLVLLRYLHGFQAVELAEMTSLSPEVVRQRLARARARLLAAAGNNTD
jgi:RNA polymerase sigma-70 factor (ECF subfamily)